MADNFKLLVRLIIVLVVVICSDARKLEEKNGTVRDGANIVVNPTCHYSDPNISECIQSLAEQGRQLLALGIPAFGIQPLEPLKVPSIRLRQHHVPNSQFKYDAWFTDVTLRGLTNYTFNKLESAIFGVGDNIYYGVDTLSLFCIFGTCSIYPEQLKVTANISLPRLAMAGEYVVIGQFQMLPVESTGIISANFTECTFALEAVGARVHKRMVIRDANVKLRCVGALDASLNEPHSTTGEMEMITDHIVKMHAREIAVEVQPAVETALAMVLEDIANKFLKHIPSDMVFPNK